MISRKRHVVKAITWRFVATLTTVAIAWCICRVTEQVDLRAPLTFLISGLAFMACSGGLPFPGLTTMEVYNIGVQAMQEERWGAAAEAFQNVLLTSGFEFAAEARLQLARSEYEREHYIESRSEYQRTLDRFPADTIGAPRGLGHLPLVGWAVAHPPSRPVVHPAGPDELPTDGVRLRRNAHRPPSLGGRLGDHDKLAEQDYTTGLHYLMREIFWTRPSSTSRRSRRATPSRAGRPGRC